jgi:hypothetical protein
MSNVSWCGGPPGNQTKMTAGSFDEVLASARNGARPESPAPAKATEPKRRKSRRFGPGQCWTDIQTLRRREPWGG